MKIISNPISLCAISLLFILGLLTVVRMVPLLAENPSSDPQEQKSQSDSQTDNDWTVPLQEMEKVQQDVSQLIRNALFAVERSPARQAAAGMRTGMQELPDKYVITESIPGMDETKLDVSVIGQVLKISGQRQSALAFLGSQMTGSDHQFGYFERALAIPNDVNPGQISAKYDNGVLTIELPKNAKTENSGAKKITVQ